MRTVLGLGATALLIAVVALTVGAYLHDAHVALLISLVASLVVVSMVAPFFDQGRRRRAVRA